MDKPLHIEVIAGILSGASGILVGQPFDNVKVFQQSMVSSSASSTRVLRLLISKNGLCLGLFGGMVPPMIGGVLYQGVMFPCYELGLMALRRKGWNSGENDRNSGRNDEKRKSGWNDDRENVRSNGRDDSLSGRINVTAGRTDGFNMAKANVSFPIQNDAQQQNPASTQSNTAIPREETWWQSALAGTFAGLCTTVFTCPLEVVKIKLQLESHGSTVLGATSKELIKLWKARALYDGWGAMAWRDGPGTAIYMVSYKELKKLGSGHLSREWLEFMAGGFAGVICWMSILPFDVIKTRIQMDAGSVVKRYWGVWNCIAMSLKEEGPSVLFRGWQSVCVRAFPANAVTFVVYEKIVRVMS